MDERRRVCVTRNVWATIKVNTSLQVSMSISRRDDNKNEYNDNHEDSPWYALSNKLRVIYFVLTDSTLFQAQVEFQDNYNAKERGFCEPLGRRQRCLEGLPRKSALRWRAQYCDKPD